MISSSFLLCATLLTSIPDVTSAVSSGTCGTHFDVRGSVVAVSQTRRPLLVIRADGSLMIFRDVTTNQAGRNIRPGNLIRTKGCVSANEYGYPAANCQSIDILGTGAPPVVTDVSAHEFPKLSRTCDLIRVQGVVREIFRDEIDPKYVYLTLFDHGDFVTVSICDEMEYDAFLKSLVDAKISVVGIAAERNFGLRKITGRTVVAYATNDIRILAPAPDNPFRTPPLSETDVSSPSEVATLGKRKVSGRVIAVRAGRDFLISDERGIVRTIRPRNADCPAFGDTVEAVGYPETDLYRLNLGDALWRKTGASADFPAAVDTDVARILTDGRGNFKINPLYHGKAIHLVGTLIDMPGKSKPTGPLTLKCGDFSVPVDISANPGLAADLAVGSRLSVAGTCIVETDNWRPHSVFPRATGVTLAVRRPEDLTILSRPPWWTTGKLMLVISSLVLALVAFVVWNRVLNRLVSKRSRALVKKQLALAEAELKVNERTRLAIELHDSLSQNLAAVAFQIVATKSAASVSPGETIDNLNAAERMLLSCRTELKRCLWDLRNDTFDIRNMTDVIQKVVAPVRERAILSVRFNVVRSRLDDSTLHAVICIVRELVSNAVRHGRAAHIRIAGDLADGILSFSVRDDGVGFDKSNCKGSAEGHFGLEGIRDRVRCCGGTFVIDSKPGDGTYAKVCLNLRPNWQEEGPQP